MRSGGGVLLVSSLQLLVGLVLLFIYEGYKSHYFDSKNIMPPSGGPAGTIVSGDDFTLNDPTGGTDPAFAANQSGTTIINNYVEGSTSDSAGRFLNTPLDVIFYLSIVNNVFSVMGGAGSIICSRRIHAL